MVGRGICVGACTCVGLANEPDGNALVCGIFSSKSASISGLLCDSSDLDCPAFVCDEEMGLLDCMAICEYRKLDLILEGWLDVYADSQLPLPRKRHLVAFQLVQTL